MKKIVLGLALAGLVIFLFGLSSGDDKTITRVDDSIVMDCKQMGEILGSPIEDLALLSYQDGAWTPIPFQIDEKKPDGTYAFTLGPKKSKDPDPNLDANDELVFMVKDTGDRIGKTLPEGATPAVEIQVQDPLNGNMGWVYLMRFSSTPPRSPKDYVSIDKRAQAKGRDRIVTEYYVMEKDSDKCYPDYMAPLKKDGTPGPDLLDRFKVREEILVPSLDLSWKFNLEEMITVQNLAWIDGPVRVMFLVKNNVQVTTYLTVEVPSLSLLTYYSNQTVIPIIYEQPKLSGSITSAIIKLIEDRMDVYIDFTPAVYGSKFFSNVHPISDDVVADGKMSEAENNLNRTVKTDWVAAMSPYGGVVFRADLPKLFDDTPPQLYYVDDQTKPDPPESDPGSCALGYSLVSVSDKFSDPDAATGMVMTLYVYFKPDMKETDVSKITDILDHPVQATAKTISIP